MNIFEELEKIKARGFIGGFAFLRHPETEKITSMAGFSLEDDGDLGVEAYAREGETLEQLIYRTILEFDEKYPQ